MQCTITLLDFWLLEAATQAVLEDALRMNATDAGHSCNLQPLSESIWNDRFESFVKLAQMGFFRLPGDVDANQLNAEDLSRIGRIELKRGRVPPDNFTDVGGKAWEAIAQPDWNQFVVNTSHFYDVGGEIVELDGQSNLTLTVLHAGSRCAAECWLNWSLSEQRLLNDPCRLLYSAEIRNWRPMSGIIPRDGWLGLYRTSGGPAMPPEAITPDVEYPTWREFGVSPGCRTELTDPDWTFTLDL